MYHLEQKKHVNGLDFFPKAIKASLGVFPGFPPKWDFLSKKSGYRAVTLKAP